MAERAVDIWMVVLFLVSPLLAEGIAVQFTDSPHLGTVTSWTTERTGVPMPQGVE
jgi:hypothetical protein